MSTRKSFLFSPPESPVAHDPSGSKRLFRPYTSLDHHVTKGRYITSNDPRGYIPVYEYPLHGQWIMIDMDDGYVLWTGIWKALGNSKADIVKMVESEPDLASRIRRVRGGYLKIQGTWMPYEVALRLSRRVAWHIRYDLVPLFGPTFPSTCMSPDQPGFGQVISGDTRRRRARRIPLPPKSTTSNSWTIISPSMPNELPTQPPAHVYPSTTRGVQGNEPAVHHSPRPSHNPEIPISSRSPALSGMSPSGSSQARHSRYSPYQPSYPRARFFPSIAYGPHHYVDSGTKRDSPASAWGLTNTGFTIPPVRQRSSRSSITLPSISDLVGISHSKPLDTATTVLERLKSDEADIPRRHSYSDYQVVQSDEFSSTLSPFCPLPSELRSVVKPPFNTLHVLSVPINVTRDRISSSSPTSSGSTITGEDISPMTPDFASDERLGTARSSPVNGLVDLSATHSKSPPRTLLTGSAVGSAHPVSPKHWPSVPSALSTADAVPPHEPTLSDGSSPHLRACSYDTAPTNSASRPLRPW